MATWTSDELTMFGDAEEIKIASVRRDGTLTKPRIIWIVRVGDDLYVRSVNGRDAAWFRSTQLRHAGRIWADSSEKDVTFVDEGNALDDDLDAAYRTKYRRYPGPVNSINSATAKTALLKLLPRA